MNTSQKKTEKKAMHSSTQGEKKKKKVRKERSVQEAALMWKPLL